MNSRRHDIDFLRVFAFSLLILYHVGMFYVYDWGWHVKSAYQAEWLQLPMAFTNQWRMSLLFVISGLAVSFIWGKYSPGHLARRRAGRLLIPLIFGLVLLVAPQPYYEALSKGVIEPGFINFMSQYLTFQDFPGEAWGGENMIVWTWNHLWYLPYVLFYTLLLIPIAIFLEGRGKALRSRFQNLRGVWMVLVPVVPLLLYGNFVYPSFPYISHAFVDDWYAHAMYGTLFLFGYMIGRDEGFWAELRRMRRPLLALGVATFIVLLVIRELVPEEPGLLLDQARAFVIYLNRWTWVLVMCAWAHHLVRRPSRALTYATSAIFPWYILHQTITVVAGFEISRFELGPVVEPLLVLGITIGGCLVLYEYVIRRVPPLRPLFGLPYREKPASANRRQDNPAKLQAA